MGDAWSARDRDMMRLALEAAVRAERLGEVPIGAVLAVGGQVVASAHNLRETAGDPTAHAELLTLRKAASAMGGWRLCDATLYCTLEPCPMCAGALWLARVDRLVYGAPDERAGAAGTLYNVVADPRLNHRLRVDAGLMADESRALLRQFFVTLRGQRPAHAGATSRAGGVAGADCCGTTAEGCPSG